MNPPKGTSLEHGTFGQVRPVRKKCSNAASNVGGGGGQGTSKTQTRVPSNIARSRAVQLLSDRKSELTWLWVKNRYPKWNPGKWNQGLNPAVPWCLSAQQTWSTRVGSSKLPVWWLSAKPPLPESKLETASTCNAFTGPSQELGPLVDVAPNKQLNFG